MLTQNNLNIKTDKLAKNILYYFFTIELIFLLLEIIINYYKFINYGPIRRLFNLAREDSLASWFMTAQTLMTGITLWLIFFLYSNNQDAKKSVKYGWATLASFFTYLAADDGALIHERIGSTFKLIALEQESSSITNTLYTYMPSYSWQIVMLPFFISMGIFILFFLWKIFGKGKEILIIVAAFGFLGSAVGLDFLEGMEHHSSFNPYQVILDMDVSNSTIKHFSKVIEELFEMFGMTLFLYIFVKHLSKITTKCIKLS